MWRLAIDRPVDGLGIVHRGDAPLLWTPVTLLLYIHRSPLTNFTNGDLLNAHFYNHRRGVAAHRCVILMLGLLGPSCRGSPAYGLARTRTTRPAVTPAGDVVHTLPGREAARRSSSDVSVSLPFFFLAIARQLRYSPDQRAAGQNGSPR